MFQQPSPYQFGYTVRAEETGDYKSHYEVSDGEEVRGVYTLGEPTGDLRVVNYTADKVNGFRATVAVHPGASPAEHNRARKLQHAETDNVDKRTRESSNTSLHDTIQPKHNTSEEKFTLNTTQSDSTNLQDNIKNNNTTTKSALKVVNSSLFDVLPGLDKHVPKIEYIVEEDYGDSDGIPVYFKDINLNSSDRPRVIPVKIQDDPYGNSLELAGSDTGGADMNVFTKVDSKQELQHSLREEVSFSRTTVSDKEITHTDTNKTEVSRIKSSTSLPPPSHQTKTNFSQIIVVNDNNQTAATNAEKLQYTTIYPVLKDSTSKLETFIDNHATKSKPDLVATVDDRKSDGKPINLIADEIVKVKETSSDAIQTQETVMRPDNKMILAALMLPSPPIIKFTCMPDNTDEIGVKITPIMPNISPTSPNIPQYPVINSPISSLSVLPHPQNTIIPSTMTSNQPLYQLNNNKIHPLSGIHFTSQAGLFKFTPYTEPHSYTSKTPPTNIPYSPTMPRSSRVDQQKTTLSDPTVEITPPPTKVYPSFGNNGNPPHKTQNFIHNRHIPLYPIPYPWIYHPVRPSHSYHPRHLPVFVLPMSHNVNFARTFDPEFINSHNN